MSKNTKTLGSRILSGLLVFGMVFSACPITTFAEEEASETSSTVVVVEDETTVVDVDNTTEPSTNDDENVVSIPTDETPIEVVDGNKKRMALVLMPSSYLF